MYDEGFATWRLKVHGLVEKPVGLGLDKLRALPHRQQITQHYCIRSWSGIAKWAACPWPRTWTWSNPIPRPAGWASTPYRATDPTEALRTTSTPPSKCATT
ncbi:molybdopterin-dependent oxidoreductase [Streptomyces sp. NPDC056231]|uniref:molybdopterin-dependent oxidoreductase n=1 Tax=Streptomyces sp. NPDC056231 TaxID=3345755 RepID=UPI003AAC6763